MQALDSAAVAAALPWPSLIESIEQIFATPGATAPARTVHEIPTDGQPASLLLKPAWIGGDVIGVKVATFFPDNGSLDRPTVHAGYLLFDGTNGSLIGACDAGELTTRRTAAASAVAAKRLARADASRLLVVGTGALAPRLAAAHAAVRSYTTIEVYGRTIAKAEATVAALQAEGLPATVCLDLDASVAAADVITTGTAATAPLVRGALLAPGTHLDLVGGFRPDMREADDTAIERSTVFVDTRADALLAGDLAQPIASRALAATEIAADLLELIDGTHPGRTEPAEITAFKSVGTALEDLAAARLAFGPRSS